MEIVEGPLYVCESIFCRIDPSCYRFINIICKKFTVTIRVHAYLNGERGLQYRIIHYVCYVSLYCNYIHWLD